MERFAQWLRFRWGVRRDAVGRSRGPRIVELTAGFRVSPDDSIFATASRMRAAHSFRLGMDSQALRWARRNCSPGNCS